MDNRSIAELTVRELEELIRRTVKTSVAEVMLEFALEADVEAQIAFEAEMNDMLRQEIQSGRPIGELALANGSHLDD